MKMKTRQQVEINHNQQYGMNIGWKTVQMVGTGGDIITRDMFK